MVWTNGTGPRWQLGEMANKWQYNHRMQKVIKDSRGDKQYTPDALLMTVREMNVV
jgi:hypothetical protein